MPGLTHEWIHEEMQCIKRKMLSLSVNLESCMDAEDLIDFEAAHALRFPADYRLYLLKIGNGVGIGGAACSEGILPFGLTPFAYPLGFSDLVKVLHKPFPYDTMKVVAQDRVSRRIHHQGSPDLSSRYDDDDDDEEAAAAAAAAAALLRTVQARHRRIGGYITLGTSLDSHDHFWILICEGSCRGEVWIVTWHGSFYPCTPRMTFKDWLMDWIDHGGYKSERSLINTLGYPSASSTALRMNLDLTNEAQQQQQQEQQQQEQQQQEVEEPVYRPNLRGRRGATVFLQSMR